MSSKTEKTIFVVMIFLFALIGACAADVVFRYRNLANGILGVAVIFFVLRSGDSILKGSSIERLILLPNRFRYFASIGVLSFLLTLAILTVYRTVDVLLF